MTNSRVLILALFSLVVIASGCTGAEINRNPKGEITLTGNESQDLSIWVDNGLGETTAFQVEFTVNESQEYFSITEDRKGKETYSVDLGEAQDGAPTSKRAFTLSGNPEKLQELNVESVSKTFEIKAYKGSSTQVIGGEKSPVDTEKVQLKIEQ